MTADYDVIWDGAHHQRDEDLLCAELRQPEKHVGVPLKAGYGAARDEVLAALPTKQPEALTFHELVVATNCNGQQVNSVLYHLRLDGILLSEAIPGRVSQHLGRRPQRYWRRT